MSKMDIQLKKVITPEARLSFAQIFEPKSFNGQEAKFSAVLLFDKKSTDMKKMQGAAKNAAVEKWGEDQKKWPKKLKWPFRDGSEKEDTDGYRGCTFITATSKTKPGIVDEDLEHVMDKNVVYSGCYVRAELIAFAYDVSGNQGVSFALQNIQKLRDGKPFSGKKDAKDVFDRVERASDDESTYGETGDENENDPMFS